MLVLFIYSSSKQKLCRPGWPGTHNEPPASAFPSAGITAATPDLAFVALIGSCSSWLEAKLYVCGLYCDKVVLRLHCVDCWSPMVTYCVSPLLWPRCVSRMSQCVLYYPVAAVNYCCVLWGRRIELCADITRQHTVTVSWNAVYWLCWHMLGLSGWLGVFCFVSFGETRSKVASSH